MEQELTLEKEMGRIKSLSTRRLVRQVLSDSPKSFWERPSSSSGHYHPPDENGLGGLVLHTKRVCMVAEVLIKTFDLSPRKADTVRAACILHDIGRYGLSKSFPSMHSRKDHPELAASVIPNKAIAAAVRSHMGRFGLTKPKTQTQWIVHMADMIAAQDWFTIDPSKGA